MIERVCDDADGRRMLVYSDEHVWTMGDGWMLACYDDGNVC